MQLCMIACSLVHIAYARSTNIDPSAAGALPGNLSQPTQECCLASPEAAHPPLAGNRLYSICGPNGWATFNLLVLAPDHLNRHGGGNKEVIRPACQAVAQRGRNSAPLALPELGPCICRAHPSAPGGRSPAPASVPCYCLGIRIPCIPCTRSGLPSSTHRWRLGGASSARVTLV